VKDRQNELLPREGGGHEHFHVTLLPIDVDRLLHSLGGSGSSSSGGSGDNNNHNDSSRARHLFPTGVVERSEICDDGDDDDDGASVNAGINAGINAGAVLAAYYFDGMPQRIFRLRMYTLYCPEDEIENEIENENAIENENERGQNNDASTSSSSSKPPIIQMKLFTLDKSLEGKLRACSESAVEDWENILQDHLLQNFNDSHDDGDDDGDGDGVGDAQQNIQDIFQEMHRCDIQWTFEPDEIRHAYVKDYSPHQTDESSPSTRPSPPPPPPVLPVPTPVHAIMMHDHDIGGVLLESQMMPGTYIRVQDELSLWENELWINDRGHDAEDIERLVYGNWGGVPYQMKRVSTLVVESSVVLDMDSADDNDASCEAASTGGRYRRKGVDKSIEWTMGKAWRTEEEYEEKMAAIGGTSTKMNRDRKSTSSD